jgi:hypothetical protein
VLSGHTSFRVEELSSKEVSDAWVVSVCREIRSVLTCPSTNFCSLIGHIGFLEFSVQAHLQLAVFACAPLVWGCGWERCCHMDGGRSLGEWLGRSVRRGHSEAVGVCVAVAQASCTLQLCLGVFQF